MVNGVLEIVAGVLFAFVYLNGNRSVIWLWIGGAYGVIGMANLLIYAIRNKTRLHAAKKQAEKSEKVAKEAEERAKSAQQSMISPQVAEAEFAQLPEE